MVTKTKLIDDKTGEVLGIPARDAYQPPPVRSAEWSAELRRAAEECEILLWGMAQHGRFKDSDELQTVAKAHKAAVTLRTLADEKLSQVGYGV